MTEMQILEALEKIKDIYADFNAVLDCVEERAEIRDFKEAA